MDFAAVHLLIKWFCWHLRLYFFWYLHTLITGSFQSCRKQAQTHMHMHIHKSPLFLPSFFILNFLWVSREHNLRRDDCRNTRKVMCYHEKKTTNTRFANGVFERVCDATLGAILMVLFYFEWFLFKNRTKIFVSLQNEQPLDIASNVSASL